MVAETGEPEGADQHDSGGSGDGPGSPRKEGELSSPQKREALLQAARETAPAPGVYLMKDAHGAILYVGKAKSLRNRVPSYFKGAQHESPRTELMVSRVDRFDVILTETETEALILECNLIKKHKPKFNVLMKDDKAFPYIRINVDEDFPRLEWIRRPKRDGARYFGPFPSAWAAKQVMKLLTETYQLRDCSDNTFMHRSRPCILHQMGKCAGPCVGIIDRAAYKERIGEAIAVLEGKGDMLIESLEKGMRDAAEREEFEEAAFYRDQLANLQVVTQTQNVVEAGQERNRDVIALTRDGGEAEVPRGRSGEGELLRARQGEAHAAILQVRSGKLLAVRHFSLKNVDADVSDSEAMAECLAQFYVEQDRLKEIPDAPAGSIMSYPREVLIPIAIEGIEAIEQLIGARIRIAETEEERQLISVAAKNAGYAFQRRSRKESGHGVKALEEIQRKLHLPALPSRIECYDISNIHGGDAVGSRVVFIDGAPDKNLYRRYKIRTVEGANDFAMMKEVLGRRFSNTEDAFPDLVVVDGGKGQLAQAVAILEELNVQGVEVCGLAKARTERDFQAAEVKSSDERIFIPGRKNPVSLYPSSDAYKLLVHVRDEAHRFAVSYHRLLRSKRTFGEG